MEDERWYFCDGMNVHLTCTLLVLGLGILLPAKPPPNPPAPMARVPPGWRRLDVAFCPITVHDRLSCDIGPPSHPIHRVLRLFFFFFFFFLVMFLASHSMYDVVWHRGGVMEILFFLSSLPYHPHSHLLASESSHVAFSHFHICPLPLPVGGAPVWPAILCE